MKSREHYDRLATQVIVFLCALVLWGVFLDFFVQVTP